MKQTNQIQETQTFSLFALTYGQDDILMKLQLQAGHHYGGFLRTVREVLADQRAENPGWLDSMRHVGLSQK